jgi:hypothetical protein
LVYDELGLDGQHAVWMNVANDELACSDELGQTKLNMVQLNFGV